MEKQRDQLQLEKVGHLEELAQSHRDVTQLTTEVEQLCRKRIDLLAEIEAHKVTVRCVCVCVCGGGRSMPR